MSTDTKEPTPGTMGQSTDPMDTRAARDGEEPPEDPNATRICFTEKTLRAQKIGKLHWVPCPEMGDGFGIYVPVLSSAERSAFEVENVTITPKRQGNSVIQVRKANTRLLSERLTIRFARHADGSKVFPEASGDPEKEMKLAEDLLAEAPAAAIGRIYSKISELAGWSDVDLEDLAGN